MKPKLSEVRDSIRALSPETERFLTVLSAVVSGRDRLERNWVHVGGERAIETREKPVPEWHDATDKEKYAVKALVGPSSKFLFELLAIWDDLPVGLRSAVETMLRTYTSLAGKRPFGEKLKWLRTNAGMTQRQLAEAAGVPIDTIRKYEQNETANVTLTVAIRLARAFGLSVAAFENCEGVDCRRPPKKQRTIPFRKARK